MLDSWQIRQESLASVARSANPTAGSVPFATSITYWDDLSPALNGPDRGSYPRGSQEEELNEMSGSLRRSTGRAELALSTIPGAYQ